eukprot:CAMPEP_0115871614 /NCGR_PEP_ID=MMETSP0287-20121206/22974_1 /TAXON_ID=412157 /ORGANISM="Chrysochromulina rotalis, Strain UIO044" /LENGTH=124 /DNA_ID=CAMNT_0003326455 /DNA_START=240 /DNA_END=615 /DNA_ORIENTATION=+
MPPRSSELSDGMNAPLAVIRGGARPKSLKLPQSQHTPTSTRAHSRNPHTAARHSGLTSRRLGRRSAAASAASAHQPPQLAASPAAPARVRVALRAKRDAFVRLARKCAAIGRVAVQRSEALRKA